MGSILLVSKQSSYKYCLHKIINSNYIHYIVKNNKILDFDSKKCYKYKPNDKCFCDSMKKYKVCCGKI